MDNNVNVKSTIILGIEHNSLPIRAIVVGDPKRAKDIANNYFDENSSTLIKKVREYRIYKGTYKKVPLIVASHGVGGPGSSIIFHELFKAGIRIVIRAGTAGSFQKHLQVGSAVIATGAVRNDGHSEYLVPKSFPAVAHYEIVQALKTTSISIKNKYENFIYDIGICHSTHSIYDGPLGNNNQLWADSNVLAQDMEISTLLVVASLYKNVKAGAIVSIDNYIFGVDKNNNEGGYDPTESAVTDIKKIMIGIALNSIIIVNDD
eukprot:TRINITY_DN1061_c0_g2_i1.p2 TRINITY_DN1061_c0_g2~~TRINITY_DN1061_c0_g2_i1.p2  ORF type:complete len:262 (-),score=69.01 TRINITY_DN1061_c0_g2_i1:161-946(-)